MWAVLLLVGLAAARPVTEDILQIWFDSNNPEYGELPGGDILEDDATTMDNIELNPMNAVRDPRRKWTNNILYYTTSNIHTSSQLSKIQAGINDLVSKTSINGRRCIDIRRRTNQAAYVAVEKGNGCSSFVGMTGSRQRLSLENGCFSHGTIMHEFLHALGFHHEQCRTDRDDWVTIDFNNIIERYRFAFRKFTSSQMTLLGTRYDYGSVMHYGPYAFATDRSKPTIIAKRSGGNQMGQRRQLSAIDIERVQVHYGCKNARDSVYFQALADIPEFNRADEWLANTELDN